MNAFLFTISVDISEELFQNSQQLEIDRQTILLETFFSTIDSAYMNEQMGDQTIREACEWGRHLARFAIRCIDGIVNIMFFVSVNKGNFLIAYLPRSIEHIVLCGCDQEYQLQTRMLPMRMSSMDLSDNYLFGTIDLQHLPPRMQSFDVSNNAIEGPIILRDLPETIENIWMDQNNIQQDVLYYGNLSDKLIKVSLERNDIRSIRPIDEETPRRDIFYDFTGSLEV